MYFGLAQIGTVPLGIFGMYGQYYPSKNWHKQELVSVNSEWLY